MSCHYTTTTGERVHASTYASRFTQLPHVILETQTQTSMNSGKYGVMYDFVRLQTLWCPPMKIFQVGFRLVLGFLTLEIATTFASRLFHMFTTRWPEMILCRSSLVLSFFRINECPHSLELFHPSRRCRDVYRQILSLPCPSVKAINLDSVFIINSQQQCPKTLQKCGDGAPLGILYGVSHARQVRDKHCIYCVEKCCLL